MITEREKLIAEKNFEILLAKADIKAKENNLKQLENELKELYAPDPPTELIGKYIKQICKNFIAYIRIDYVNSYSSDDHLQWIRYCGFGMIKNNKGHISISNREIITKCINLPAECNEKDLNGEISEITKEEFNQMFQTYMEDVSYSINWKSEFN